MGEFLMWLACIGVVVLAFIVSPYDEKQTKYKRNALIDKKYRDTFGKK
ncbi:hypothetical protein [Streptococcus sp. sy010]|nr:hypothetical protein [Streptococcus sp. sy010]